MMIIGDAGIIYTINYYAILTVYEPLVCSEVQQHECLEFQWQQRQPQQQQLYELEYCSGGCEIIRNSYNVIGCEYDMNEEQFFGMLVRVYFSTRTNKRYGCDQMDFESNWIVKLVRYWHTLLLRKFRISLNYAFLTSVPKWREIFATIFEGRMADHLLCDPLLPYIERELSPRTFNNRLGMGTQAAVNQICEDIVTVTDGYTKQARIIKWDISACFPSAIWDYMEQCFVNVIEKYRNEIAQQYGEWFPNFLRWLAMVLIHSCPSSHCELRTPAFLWREYIPAKKSMFGTKEGRGAPIGRLTSQHAMGLYLNDEVKWLNEECGINTVLFVDDGAMIMKEEYHAYALSLMPELRRRLANKGLKLNEHKFYDQPYQHGLEFLGSHIKPFRLHINNKTYNRAVERIKEFNRMPSAVKYDNIDCFIASFNSYTGMLKNRTDYKRLIKLKEMVSNTWWNWLDFDQRRLCVVSKPRHSNRTRLGNKYKLKLKTKSL